MLRIRQASIDDVELISRIVSESAQDGIAPTLTQYGADHLLSAMTSEKMSERIESGRFHFFIGEVEGEPIAVSCIRLPTHLYYLFVDKSHQGKGVGRALWQHALEHIRGSAEADASEVTLNSSLNAMSFYERFGFEKTGPVEEQNEVQFQPMAFRFNKDV